MWPSFNAATALPAEQTRAITNTFLSLTGATISTFVLSRLVSSWKFEAVHIQNSTLAGGVVMGVAAHLEMHPSTAIGMGFLAGVISVLGFRFLTPYLTNKLNLQDICGINNLHGMPGILGSILAVAVTSVIGHRDPSRFAHGTHQGAFQLLGLLVTLVVAISAALGTGALFLLLNRVYKLMPEEFFNDRPFWAVPTDYTNVVRQSVHEMDTFVKAKNQHVNEDGLHGESPNQVIRSLSIYPHGKKAGINGLPKDNAEAGAL